MIKSLMYHKVEDFNTWKAAFDGFLNFRKSAGELSYSVGNLHDQPNTVFVINEWKSLEAIQAFENSAELANAMKSAGVLERPTTLIFNEVENG